MEKLKIGIAEIECWPNKYFGIVKEYELHGLPPFDPKWYRSALRELLDERFESYFSVSFLFSEDLNFWLW